MPPHQIDLLKALREAYFGPPSTTLSVIQPNPSPAAPPTPQSNLQALQQQKKRRNEKTREQYKKKKALRVKETEYFFKNSANEKNSLRPHKKNYEKVSGKHVILQQDVLRYWIPAIQWNRMATTIWIQRHQARMKNLSRVGIG